MLRIWMRKLKTPNLRFRWFRWFGKICKKVIFLRPETLSNRFFECLPRKLLADND